MDDTAAIARAELTACLHRITTGDHAALEMLYRRTCAKLFGICKRILDDHEAAEDVLQEVYVIVWRKAAQFDAAQGVSPITWLAVIARNRALDRARAQPRRFAPLEAAAEIPDRAVPADDVLAAAAQGTALARCLDALDARAASAIRQAFFGGSTYQTLAASAGMPLATMKSLIRRALLQLRSCLGHD
jgi:RNA polymerase sigma-70 factor (ECF subfamily)